MSKPYKLNYEPINGNPDLAGFEADLARYHQIDSRVAFNDFCRTVCRLWAQHLPQGRGSTGGDFQSHSRQIEAGAVEDKIIPTSWGGVVVTSYHPPCVEKYLVIRQGGYLALEKHAEKDEHMEVVEGTGILLWRDDYEKSLSVHELRPGSEFHFKPGMEHCIIGTEDLLIFERSTDPLGMDQDLIFIYTPAD